MGSDQHFCLRWNNFHSNIAASFEHLRDSEEFVDVTLACEGKSLKAHKVVLSACSPYFKNLLKQNPCQHPIIIFRDVAFPDLSALLSFVYQGEVYVAQDRLTTFLRTAEMLHIKGLTEQTQHHQSNAGIPVSLGPPPSTMILPVSHDPSRAEFGSVGNLVKVGSSSPCHTQTPPSPSAHLYHLPVHISPPPKKRRPAHTTTSSPTPMAPVSPAQSETSALSRVEGSTLAAALTKPLLHTRSDTIISPVMRSTTMAPSSPHTVPKVKQEHLDDLKQEEEEAVNLVMEGSILRQRIQGYQSSPDAPPNCSLTQTMMMHEESSMDEFQAESCPGDTLSDGGDQEVKEVVGNTPLVIRSPLIGLLPRETQGLYSGAGTSSLPPHDSSQDAPARHRWRCMQPRLCPFCWKTFSNSFNLKQHIVNVHTVGDGIQCQLCHKTVKNKWYLRKHQVTAHGAPLRRSKLVDPTPDSETLITSRLACSSIPSATISDAQQQNNLFTDISN